MRSAMTQPLSAPVLRTSREGAISNNTVGALHRSVWTLVAVVMSVAWFALLDVRKLQHPDEGRYAEIAREMLVSSDWVTPRLNGLKYFEKPPLQYWLTAASYKVFELDEWTARLPGTIAGWLAIFVVGYAGTRIASPTAGAYAAVVLAGMVWHFGIAHIVTLDALLGFWLTVALAAFLVAQRAAAESGERRALMLIAWAAMAGALMTKGLIGLLIPAGALVVYTLLTRDFALWRRLELVLGTLLLVALAAPWFVLVSRRNAEFAQFFFVHEHFQRFLTTEHRRTGGWWYFIPLLIVGLLPWLGMFFLTAIRGWRDAERGANGFAWARFCLVWVAFVFLFFSASGSKLPSYILPLFPAAALLVGWQLVGVRQRTLFHLTWPLAAGAWILLALTLLFYDTLIGRIADARTPALVYAKLYPFVVAGFAAAGLGYSLSAIAFRRAGEARRSWGIIGLSLATIVTLQLVFSANDAFRVTRSAADIVTALENETAPPYDRNAPVFQVGMYDQTFPFYLQRTSTLVAYRDELALGLDAEPQKGIPREDDWVGLWRTLPQAYALLGQDTLDKLAAHGLPYRVVARDPRRVLIARQ
jgi:4-amino-4-deoxy-L-arabinose transferase-like glycosyltransferase